MGKKYLSYNKYCEDIVVTVDILVKTKKLDMKQFKNGDIVFKKGDIEVNYDMYKNCLRHLYHIDNRNMKNYEEHLTGDIEL